MSADPQPTACPGRHGPCWLASMPQWAVDEEFADIAFRCTERTDR